MRQLGDTKRDAIGLTTRARSLDNCVCSAGFFPDDNIRLHHKYGQMTIAPISVVAVRRRLHAIVLCAAIPLFSGCIGHPQDQGLTEGAEETSNGGGASEVAVPDAEVAEQVKVFCGACHAVPIPDSFPRQAWYDEVRQGFNFYYESGRTDLIPPRQASVVAWYQQRAPEKLAKPDESETGESPVNFELRPIDVVVDSPELVAVSVLRMADSDSGASQLWVSDMRRGVVVKCDVNDPTHAEVLRIGSNPAGTCDVDLDQNGSLDLVVADLGSFLPEDHSKGQVLWYPDGKSNDVQAGPRVILDSIGRVADVQPGDLDNDGDQDLVVAEFGWHKTGGIHVLFNDVSPTGERTFRDLKVDSRPGTIHVPVRDLDGDGRLDFVALISQEYEVIEAFMNRESGFEKIQIYAAPDPSYGSSGIKLTDFDGDGDGDILYTVGDTFDSYLIKPYHGIWLLRNEGQLKFKPQRIAAMPGVLRAVNADLDGDGDQDIIAAALLSPIAVSGKAPTDLQALIWLEQTADGEFARHVIQRGLPIYASLAVSDIDGDSDLDIVAGCFHAELVDPPSLLHVFENLRQGKDPM